MNDPRDLAKHLAALLRREHGALGDPQWAGREEGVRRGVDEPLHLEG
jgi:hypothetical protein